ncbi:MAG: type VI secretion system baseplate subunit TssE [Candidatus Competibacterales bacterium]
MAELSPKERLQPFLLDRLSDDNPRQRVESRESRTMSWQKLRQGVLRDLAWLMNTCRLEAGMDLAAYPEVRRSVLNYGLPDLTGQTISDIASDAQDLEETLKRALIFFEPRLLPKTLKVQISTDTEQMNRNALAFDIEGELWARPAPLFLRLRTELDLDNGDISIQERGGSASPATLSALARGQRDG